MALTPEKAARLAELEKKFGKTDAPIPESKKPENVGEFVKQEAPFFTKTIPDALKGAANKARETGSQPILRFLANAGLPSARKEMEGIDKFNASHVPTGAEKVGGVLGDAGMLMLPTPAGKAGLMGRIAGVGIQGAAQHQAQNYAKTGEMNPGEATAEVLGTAALMGAGSAVKPALQSGAAQYLKLLTRAPKRLERGLNPPTTAGFRQALEKKIFPILGGYKEAEKRGIATQVKRDAEKIGILEREGVKGNVPEAIREAETSIAGRSGGRRGLLPTQKEQGISQLSEYKNAYKDPYYQSNTAGALEGEGDYGLDPKRFIDLRKMADQNANFIEGKTPAGLDLASQEFRTAAEDQLGRKMVGKSGEAQYGKLKNEMAELAPVLEAFNEKAISNYSLGPELISGLLGTAVGSPWLAAAPLARRVPQVAPAMYEVGRAAGSKAARMGAKGALDLGRAATYGVLRNEENR